MDFMVTYKGKTFDELDDFSKDRARIKSKNKIGWIDIAGNFAIIPIYNLDFQYTYDWISVGFLFGKGYGNINEYGFILDK